MAFDGFKKMADGVPDYLEVPVTEDGLLEKATAAIHALGYDMEEAISIFLCRIVQTVPSAADLAQAEEFICKIADTALDDMVTQPLLIPKRDVFSVELLDYVNGQHVPIGTYIKYPKNSSRQRWCKKASSARVRKYMDLPSKGNSYRRVFDYWWTLY